MPRQGTVKTFITDHFTLVRENRKLITQFILTILFIALGAWFFKHEQPELREVKNVLLGSRLSYVIAGISVTALYIILQGLMYKMAFASVGSEVPLSSAILLFLQRNFISIFIPAGGVTSLAFFSGDIEKQGVSKTKIHFSSSIYAFVGILSVVIVAIPIFIYSISHGLTGLGEMFGIAGMLLVIGSLYFAYRSIVGKRFVYKVLVRFFPAMEVFLENLISHSINSKNLILTILVSIIIDLTCIANVYLAMLALNFNPSLAYAMLGYLMTVVSLFISPFMRGLGVVEVSLSFILTRFGYSGIEAIAITFLYRFFEFWLPLLTGALSFLLKINKLLMRIIPALLIFSLGIINIVSAITPAIHERVQRLEEFIPLEAISASNFLVLLAGGFMLLSAVFMFKGLRSAWWIALFLSITSVIGHLTKAIDYEEAMVALAVIAMLLFSRKEYYIRGNPRLHTIGIRTALWSIAAVLVYGIVGFYFLDKKHFGIDFSALQSIRYTAQNFFLTGSADLIPSSRFAKDFVLSINISGFLSLSFLFYTIVRPFIFKVDPDSAGSEKAKTLVSSLGTSGLDYFKTYGDKLIFAPDGLDAFLSYRTAGNFAVVLENPVAENAEMMKRCIVLFDEYCYQNSLKSIYYRVPEESLPIYRELSKKSLFLGQEGVVDLNSFSLEGGKNKPTRNAINKVTDRGYKSSIHTPPVKDGLMQKLKAVSDEWLNSTQRNEIIFSQGMFDWNELKNQTIITVENPEEKVMAFLNIIPDYAPGEGTYDLIRKTNDAPNGVMDFILVELFKYLKSQNYSAVNLGFAPLSGLDDPHTFPEKSMEFAYEKIKSFSHYKGLRNFKEKFFPAWHNKFLIYSNDYDLLQVPAVLKRVMKTQHV
ncbi:MAG: phosphatidylglycerol lysyltransferase domain-containing protein [Bacteroidia bacterium]|nr:phosphatidylglycerol lysyltransferase domain-containing protein [Bacteroidia bacterium]